MCVLYRYPVARLASGCRRRCLLVWHGQPRTESARAIFCGTTDLPEMFKICGNHRYRLDAALWHYRQANKLATVRWGNARKILEKNLLHFERKGLEELPMVEQRYAELVKSQGEEAAKLI